MGDLSSLNHQDSQFEHLPQAAAAPEPGEKLGDYQLLRLLGRGGMGMVFQARSGAGRNAAVKVFRPDLCGREEFQKELKQRFIFEAIVHSSLSHPHIVQFLEFGFDRGRPFFVMEYAAGGHIAGFLRNVTRKELRLKIIVKLLAQAAEGLLEAERFGIVHRDIKPENLLIEPPLCLKISDFGIARRLGARASLTNRPGIFGTPLYISPEQLRGQKADHRSDMYALGATFHHLITGRPPILADTLDELSKKKLSSACLSPAFHQGALVPLPLRRIIENLTAKNPEDRYLSFVDLLEDLHRIQRGQEIAPRQKNQGLFAAATPGQAPKCSLGIRRRGRFFGVGFYL